MALDPLHSDQWMLAHGSEGQGNSLDLGAKVNYSHTYWIADTESSAGTAIMTRLPAGRIILLNQLCAQVATDGGTATADLDIGHGAYVQQDGTAVAADVDEWLASADIGGGAVAYALFPAGAKAIYYEELNSKEGIDITMTIDTAVVQIGTRVDLYLFYVTE